MQLYFLYNHLHVGLGGGSVAAASCGFKSISVEMDAFYHVAAIARMSKFADEKSMEFYANNTEYTTRPSLDYHGPACDEDKRLDSTFKVQTITPFYEDVNNLQIRGVEEEKQQGGLLVFGLFSYWF